MARRASLLGIVLVLLVTVVTVVFLYEHRPQSRRHRSAGAGNAPAVRVLTLRPATVPVTVVAYGTVVAARQLPLRAQVSGTVLRRHPRLEAGGVVAAGEELLALDPRDYQLQVTNLEAQVAEARLALLQAESRRETARREWQRDPRRQPLSDAAAQLVLHEPQYQAARAHLAAAESRLARARRDLERTVLTAPFTALVLEGRVEAGQVVAANETLATLVAADRFRVTATVPLDRLERLQHDSPVTVQRLAGDDQEQGVSWPGRLLRLAGTVEPAGQLARVLVEVAAPLGERPAAGGHPHDRQLLLGEQVRLTMDGGSLQNVVVLPRQALRDNDTVWLVDRQGRLAVRRARVRWQRQEDVLAELDLAEGEPVITSRLTRVVPGMAVRVVETESRP